MDKSSRELATSHNGSHCTRGAEEAKGQDGRQAQNSVDWAEPVEEPGHTPPPNAETP